MDVSGTGQALRVGGPELSDLGVVDLAREIAGGRVSAREATRACLSRIEATESEIGAWAHVDPEYAMTQARALDAHRGEGRPLGPLHGVPVGVKDIIDVLGLPCERGTVLDAGRRPDTDATVVSRLRGAGAVILGKTVSTELALYHPGKTRNPHNVNRTPGGSSSGSAAAVAARMVPAALGSQTNGSVIRPSSFCGIYGYKPGMGLVPRTGVLPLAPTLDTVGVMARALEDVALLTDVIAGYDPDDASTAPSAPPALLETASAEPPVRPAIAFVRTPVWDKADADTRAGLAELCAAVGDVDDVALPEPFERAHDLHHTLMAAEAARHYAHYYERGQDRLSERVRAFVEDGRRVLAVDYMLAHDWIGILNAALDRIFERYDAILAPAANGEAPRADTTGDPAFSTLWTFCGVPAVSLPLLVGETGLPIGAQLIGRRGHDGRLLRTARWLVAEATRGTGTTDPATGEHADVE